jgi:hypothetical protein
MKKLTFFLITLFTFLGSNLLAQTQMRQEKVGHQFFIMVPEYMTRTLGINDAASVQFKSVVKDVYTFVIEDSKADLELVEMKFSSVSEFYDDFIKDFLVGTKDRSISPPTSLEVEGVKYVQSEASYYDKEAKSKIYYNITVAETGGYFYKILSYTAFSNKDKFRDDFTKLALTIRD